jgi:hypothetical protein
MRSLRWAFATMVALALSNGAQAQTNGNFSTALTGVNASNLQFKPIDTSGALQLPSGTSQMSSSTFNVSGFFRRLVGMNSATPIIGQSNIPAAQYNPAVSPLPPILSTVPH